MIRYYVTVKKAKFTTECDIRVSQTASGKYSSTVAFRVVNKSGVFVSDAEVLYALIDQNGTTVEQKSFKVYDLVPGATVYKTVSFDIQDTYVAAATGGVQTWTRNPSYKYTNMTKKVNIKMTSQTESSMSFTFKNKSKKTVNGTADLLFLDAEGKILFIRQMSFYLQPKATSTDTAGYIPEGTVSTKLVKRAYAKDYVG
ncbi:MAG: hypothetical protein J6P16_06130 [Eubacterium sp.]|nr:hypothetical protein [Eubacterium sp.]